MIPKSTTTPGWPEYLTDNAGAAYVRLRDGQQTSEFTGAACLYGLLDEDRYIDRKYQWIPTSTSTREDMTLSGGPWMTSAQLVKAGQPPIKIPDEPVSLTSTEPA